MQEVHIGVERFPNHDCSVSAELCRLIVYDTDGNWYSLREIHEFVPDERVFKRKVKKIEEEVDIDGIHKQHDNINFGKTKVLSSKLWAIFQELSPVSKYANVLKKLNNLEEDVAEALRIGDSLIGVHAEELLRRWSDDTAAIRKVIENRRDDY